MLLYQLVHLTSGGEPTKMSKRRGDVVLLDDVLGEIGVDAARWYLVNRGPDQTIEIDIDLAAEKSQKNPVYYVQYAHARIAAILNADGAEIGGHSPGALAGEEKELIKRLPEFPVRCARRPPSEGRSRSRVRDPRRGRLPSLLHGVQRARRPRSVVPPGALPRDAGGDRPRAPPCRSRRAGQDVIPAAPNQIRGAFE